MKEKKLKNTKEVIIFQLKVILAVILIDLMTVFITYFIMPSVQGFPPYSEDFNFQREVQTLTHIQQYTVAFLLGVSIHLLSFKLLLKNICNYMNKYYQKAKISIDEVRKVREDCLNIPYKVFIVQMALFFSVGLIVNFVMLVQFFSIIKFTLMIISLSSLISIFLLIVTQRLLYKVMITTYDVTNVYDRYTGFRITNSKSLLIQIVPFIAVILFIISLIGYSKAAEQEGFATANYYRASLDNRHITPDQIYPESLKEILSSIPLQSSDHYYFIIYPNDSKIELSNPEGEISDFVLKYRDYFMDKTNGVLYEKFGVDAQLYALKLVDSNGDVWYIGYKYPVLDTNLLSYYLMVMIIVIFAYIGLLYIISKNMSKNITKIADSLKDILDTENINDIKILPITSNDEFGDVAYYYNKIQELTRNNIEQIHNNQDKLMEKERLASLGQLIGGIAHNLKTPIMSISGAAEGLHDLISEYDSSIEDPEVNAQDHHDIAKDMSVWIDKIKSYTEYMSDVITAVKGQAVTLSDEQSVSFTIEEFIKRVDILMKHELKNALVSLNIAVKVDPDLELKGNVNSLVQVVNNMISNSIQAYGGKTNQSIDLTVVEENSKIIISIQDYAGGMPEDVKDKLFKEMITTKGKNGTGLGLFMSYSTIRGHFNGNITFESEKGKGTIFHISLPI